MKRKRNRQGKSVNPHSSSLPKFNKQNSQALFHQTFSPTIMECKVPERFINIINGVGDTVLKDDN